MLKAFSKGKAGNQPLHRNKCKKNGCIKLPSNISTKWDLFPDGSKC